MHGESLGTTVAVDLVSRHQCGGVVLGTAFTAASDVAGTVLPMIGPLLIRSVDSRQENQASAGSDRFSSTATLIIPFRCSSAGHYSTLRRGRSPSGQFPEGTTTTSLRALAPSTGNV